MRTAAAYIRVSTDDQTEFSPDAQLKRIKEYAASHDILLLPDHIYTELGVSGRSAARRPRFMALMTAAGFIKTKDAGIATLTSVNENGYPAPA